jgi:GNAT superfamily N-acetyltransferase
MSVTIRPFGIADNGACRELWRQLTQHHRDIYRSEPIGGDDSGLAFDQYRDDPNRVASWVAERDGEVVGFAGLLVKPDGAELEPVVVARSARRQGVARQLVAVVLAAAVELGHERVSVRPVGRNADAIACFAALGFTTLGHVELMCDLPPRAPGTWDAGQSLHGTPLDC